MGNVLRDVPQPREKKPKAGGLRHTGNFEAGVSYSVGEKNRVAEWQRGRKIPV